MTKYDHPVTALLGSRLKLGIGFEYYWMSLPGLWPPRWSVTVAAAFGG